MKSQKSILISAVGGTIPGINTLVATIAKTFLSNGYRVIGLHGGFTGLFCQSPVTTEIDFRIADDIFNRGGSYLKTNSFQPYNENKLKDTSYTFLKKNNIELLITIGGAHTASSANKIIKLLESDNYYIQNIHIPLSINDCLPFPADMPKCGYESAMNESVHIAQTIYNDARSSESWFIVTAQEKFGRLTLDIGTACHYPMIIIPEMFKTKITYDKITSLIISSIIKRKIMGINYGAVIISPMLLQYMDEIEIMKARDEITQDACGHIEFGKIPVAHLLSNMLEKKLKKMKLNVKSRAYEIRHTFRGQDPCPYDLKYCTMLGLGAYKLYKEGKSGCIVYINKEGNIEPLYIKDFEDENGYIPPRFLDIELPEFQPVFNYMIDALEEKDYKAASKYIKDVEDFDIRKILNW